MAGIQVHTASPINTNFQEDRTQNEPEHVAASTTAYAANSEQTAKPARPGQPAVAAPTAAASKYAPTKTTVAAAAPNPPPPQPGQAPEPMQRGRTMPTRPQVNPFFTAQTYHQPPMPVSPRMWTPTYAYMQTQDLSHPPGYVQNHHASFDDVYSAPENKTHAPSPTRGGGLLDGAPILRNTEDSPIWDTAVGWAKEAGRKLSEVENEVWKRINKE